MRKVILSILALFFLVSLSTADQTIKVKTSGGTEKIQAIGKDDRLSYSLSELQSVLGGDLKWRQPGISVAYNLDTARFVFTIGSPYITLNDTIFNLVVPVTVVRGELFVPAATFTPLLDLIRPENISWDGSAKTIRVNAEWFNITDINISAKQNGLLIEIFMTSPLNFEIYESEGNWLNIDFPEARIDRAKILSPSNRTYLRKINAFQFDASAQISFRLRRGYKNFHHTYKTNPGRLQIAIESESFTADSSLVGSGRIGPDEKIDVIVIDAGHGGTDFGAIGRHKKTREKQITLEIAQELAKMIRKDKQFKVIMTRTKDRYVSLNQRAKIANDAKADLFISIHCNSSTKKSANGHQVFYLAPAKSDAARAVAQFENAPFLIDESGLDKNNENDLAFILNDMIQTEFITESADLAYMADLEMRKRLKIKSRNVDHAAFFVLNRVYMPSILVESAFLSNKNEEKKLRSSSFRKKVATSIYEAIKRFKAKYERI